MSNPYQMIETAAALQDLVARLQNEECLALDTEFVWERTYYARLGLVQIGLSDGTCFLVDAVALDDLTPLGDVLANPRIAKILHDAPQDLMILRRATGRVARHIFDTRLAAGFAGLSSTLSLGNLLAELLDVHLAKAHTRADWIARPLAPEVLDYAADDVRYLPQVATWIRERARETGTEAWMDEELSTLEHPASTDENSLDDAYLRIRAAATLPPRNLAVLRELAAWREREARERDLPRRWFMEDGALMSLATALPSCPSDLARCGDLPPKAPERHGDALLGAIQRGLSLAEVKWPPPVFQPNRDKAFKQALEAASREIQAHAESRKIDPALVCSRNDLARFLTDGAAARPEDHELLRGWRAEFLGDRLVPLLPKSLF